MGKTKSAIPLSSEESSTSSLESTRTPRGLLTSPMEDSTLPVSLLGDWAMARRNLLLSTNTPPLLERTTSSTSNGPTRPLARSLTRLVALLPISPTQLLSHSIHLAPDSVSDLKKLSRRSLVMCTTSSKFRNSRNEPSKRPRMVASPNKTDVRRQWNTGKELPLSTLDHWKEKRATKDSLPGNENTENRTTLLPTRDAVTSRPADLPET